MAAARGNTNAKRHGLYAVATKSGQIGPRAANQKRRILRQIGTRRADLDPAARGYLDLLARLLAKIEIADEFIEREGMIQPDGEVQPVLRLYVSLVNSARLTLGRLEEHLRKRSRPLGAALADYLEADADDDEDGTDA